MSATTAGPQPVTLFGWDDWKQGEGGKWKSPGGRVLSDPVYQRMKAKGGKAAQKPQGAQAPAPAQKPATTPPPSPPPAPPPPDDAKALAASLAGAAAAVGGGKPPSPGRPPKQRTGFTRLEQLMDLPPEQQEAELLKRSARATPEEQVAVRAAAAVRPNPRVTAAVDAQKPALDARHGERASRIFRAVADVFGRVVGAVKDPLFLGPAAGMAAGGGLGAVVGTLVGGPFGVGVGTAVGAGLGTLIGDKLGRYMTAARLKVAARKVLRQTVPAAAGTLAGVGAGAVTWPLAAAGASWGMSPGGVTQQLLGIDVWGSVFKLAGAPFKLAGLVYGGLRRAIEPSAAKERQRAGETLRVPARRMAEEPDPVAEAKRVMAQAGIDTTAVSDEKVALALAIAAAVEDSGPGQDVEAFAWGDWKQVDGGKWRSPGGRVLSDPVYQAMRRSGAAEPQPGVVGKVADAARGAAAAAGKAMGKTKVGRAVQSADAKAGKVAGRVTQKVVEWKDRQAAALKQKTLEGKFGGLLKWAAGSAVGKAFFTDLQRRGDRVKMTAREAQSLGFVGAKLNGAERVISYVKENFDRNRRRYGVVPAALIEGAVAAVKFALPPLVVGAATAAGAASGLIGGPAGGVAGGLAAGALGVGFTRWLAKSLIGKGMASAARAVGETAAASVKRLLSGKSRVRARKGAPVNLRLAPQPVTANAEGGAAPTVADLIAEVQTRAGEELGIDLPPELAADLLTQLADRMPAAVEQDGAVAVAV